MRISILLTGIFMLSLVHASVASPHIDFTVAADGSGDFTTLTAAIDALPMYTYERVVIFIKKGIYNEKIRIEQNNITLLGEDKDSTIIQYNQLREDWIKNKDYIGPAVINIHADDIILKNLTIINTQPQVGPHAFAIYGTGTRTILYNCNVLSKGGDTVSLWNYKHGMYYHAKCTFEGAVDFVCPRGWCYVTDSHFYEVLKTAAIWHAAVTDKNQKFVIRNSHFDGIEGFQLGRHHYEAQFYLLDCTFSKNMADKPIYHVINEKDPTQNRPYYWGDRYYYYNCRGEGINYSWYKNNLSTSGASADSITAAWTFDGKWNPESGAAPQLIDWEIEGTNLYLNFAETLSLRGKPILKTSTGKELSFAEGRGRKTLRFACQESLTKADVSGTLQLSGGEIIATQATVMERPLPAKIKLPEVRQH